MGLAMFWMAVLGCCLLWSAAWTAVAARVPAFRRLLALCGWLVPALVLLPAVAVTAALAFGPRLPTNAFAATLTLWIAAVVGGVWIVIAGLTADPDGQPVARRWPAIGLAGLCLIAGMVACGTLLAVDNAIQAEARQWRVEAAALMQANLPPAVSEADNAATLHHQVTGLLAADPALTAADTPLGDPSGDARAPAAMAMLDRHAETLDIIRRAADRDVCRFDRDWSRPSIDMLLPEMQQLRTEARLLAAAARRAAAEGRGAEALADTIRIHRLARQITSEPILITHLVSLAIDALARDTLARVLPSLEPEDLPLLDDPGLEGLCSPPPPLLKTLLGEETLGLSVFSDLSTGRLGLEQIGAAGVEPGGWGWIWDRGALLLRSIFLPSTMARYRTIMHHVQQFAASHPVPSRSDVTRLHDATTNMVQNDPLVGMLQPAFQQVFDAQIRAAAGSRAAAVLVAATRRRLADGGLPESLESLVPARLPAVPTDPFTENAALQFKPVEGGFVVWSIGPDGEDDGGPPSRTMSDTRAGNDDVGLWLVPDGVAEAPAGSTN